MQQDNSSKKPINKIAIGALVFAVFLVAIIAIVVILNLTITKPASKTARLIPADEVISTYQNSANISVFPASAYTIQQKIPNNINYKISSETYSVSIITDKTLAFYAKNKTQKDDSSLAQSQTTIFMKDLGLNQVSNTLSTDQTARTIIYSSDATVCQFFELTLASASPLSQLYELGCVDIGSVTDKYASIEKLLAIYKKTEKLDSYTQASQDTRSKDNISYSIINLTTKTDSPSLLFGAVDNSWEYIGNLSDNSASATKGKYSITPETKTKISDPKYKGFISSNIQ